MRGRQINTKRVAVKGGNPFVSTKHNTLPPPKKKKKKKKEKQISRDRKKRPIDRQKS